ncbi:hypothetical protein JCGZ_07745 [Jatropha curcas]|uniref:Auxin-responsive protein n=1 Tax=Jatropha curcas TaxID=180498 RepID=A0A067KQU1_JATCU|nr:auxin-responsive protein IAA2 [Jatropha curcas]KDP34174.1 hypothetical protein JCGZ_07745 [Jatropha curcas]
MEEEWHGSDKAAEDKTLELRLGPPGEFLNYKKNITTIIYNGAKRDRFEEKTGDHEKQCKKFSCCEGGGDLLISSPWSKSSNESLLHSLPFQKENQRDQNQEEMQKQPQEHNLQCLDNKACSGTVTASFPAVTTTSTNTSHHKRVTAAAVVGWPPIRSFRRNLASSSSNSKLTATDDLANKTSTEDCTINPQNYNCKNDLFVKINMEGVPIGRKINLNAYDSYQKLSVAIDELFRGLLAAQRETCEARNVNKIDVAKGDAGLTGTESGEYTLVYQDSEGDTILVGDVPWQMFVSTAKRLRVLKSSELSTPRLSLGRGEQDMTSSLAP